MRSKRLRDLDAAIEDLLQEEDLKPAPFGLRHRIENRLQYVALQNSERRRFRELVAAGATGTLALSTTVMLAAWHLTPIEDMAGETPGARGFFDRLAVSIGDSCWILAGTIVCAVLAAGTLALLLAWPSARLLGWIRSR